MLVGRTLSYHCALVQVSLQCKYWLFEVTISAVFIGER